MKEFEKISHGSDFNKCFFIKLINQFLHDKMKFQNHKQIKNQI